MEGLSDDEVGQILQRVKSRADRRACAQVCAQWHRVEGFTRSALRVLDPQFLQSYLPHFPNLLTLEATTGICDSDLACIGEQCQSLQILNLNLNRWRRVMDLDSFDDVHGYDGVGDSGLEAIAAGCKDLQHISLRWRQGIGDIGVSALARNCHSLVQLDFAHCKRITDQALEALSSAPSVQVLILRSCTLISDWGIGLLGRGRIARTLRRLDLCECDQLTDGGIVLLQLLPVLQILNLAECGARITDLGGVAIAGICTLQSVNLAWLVNITDVSLLAFGQNCLDLREVNLSGCELVTGVGLRAFSRHGALQALTLSACFNIYSDDVDQTVTSCLGLEYLGLDRTLRPWMPADSLERLQNRCQIEWL